MPFKKVFTVGIPVGMMDMSKTVTTDAMLTGWGCHAPVLELLYIFLYSLRALGTMSHSLKQQTLNLNSSITAMLKYLNNKLPRLSS